MSMFAVYGAENWCVISVDYQHWKLGTLLYAFCFNLYCGGSVLFCGVCMNGFCNVCVCEGFVMCGCFW
jgi:hypothetical protein